MISPKDLYKLVFYILSAPLYAVATITYALCGLPKLRPSVP
jgi:hypothetical protein